MIRSKNPHLCQDFLMPTWDKIINEFQPVFPSHLEILKDYITKLSEHTGNTTICYFSAFTTIRKQAPSSHLSIIDQDMQGFMTCSHNVKKDCLDLIIHTPGGDFEATKRIISYLHQIYDKIRVFVPHLSMSGGTLIACAADEIYMGPYSSLGPTDPQIPINGAYVPVGGIIKEIQTAFEEVEKNPQRALLWQQRLNSIPIGMYNAIMNLIDNSEKYLIELLAIRNCKNNGCNIPELAKFLNSHDKHSGHGRGINLALAKETGLNVVDLSEDKELEDRVLSIYHAAAVLFDMNNTTTKIIMNNSGGSYIISYNGN